MNVYRHISKKLRDQNARWILFLLALAGLGISVEERSFYPLLILTLLGLPLSLLYGVISGIRAWRFEIAIRKLKPDQIATMFGDIVREATWNPEAKRELSEFLKKKGD